MKGQGLPISFVVLAAIAILILVLAVAFIVGIRGSAVTALTQSEVQQKCEAACNSLKLWAQKYSINSSYYYSKTGPVSSNGAKHAYCNSYTVKGMGTVTCDNITTCTVEDIDGIVHTVSCSNGVPQFS